MQLLGDRLTLRKLEDEGGPIQYIPLDRISMRPRPRGYRPYVGVHLLEARCNPLKLLPAPHVSPGDRVMEPYHHECHVGIVKQGLFSSIFHEAVVAVVQGRQHQWETGLSSGAKREITPSRSCLFQHSVWSRHLLFRSTFLVQC